jgi:hypothetical protein
VLQSVPHTLSRSRLRQELNEFGCVEKSAHVEPVQKNPAPFTQPTPEGLMTLMYILGNLVGRALVSYVLVWLVCWLFSRFDWRLAFKRSKRWYGVCGVIALTLLGMASVLSKGVL